jgi:diguanylate cyclase (GGDEF)-like protein/PAS domain S-box-containing protein
MREPDPPPTGNPDARDLVARALDGAPDPIALLQIKKNAQYAYVNRAFCDVFGYAATALVGARPRLLTGALTDQAKFSRLRAAAFAGEPSREVLRLYTASGEARMVEIRERPILGTYRISHMRDVTQETATNEALIESNQRLSSLLEHNSEAVFTLDANGRCLAANPAAENLFGVPADGLLGHAYLDVVTGGLFPGQSLFPDALRTGRTLEYRATFELPGGRSSHAECTAVPMIVAGETRGAYVLVKDVSEAWQLATVIEERARRTRALYLISAEKGSDAEQIDSALTLVLNTFGMQYAFLGQIKNDRFFLSNVVGQGLVEVGDEFPLEKTRLRITVKTADVYAVDDISDPANRLDGVPHYPGWHGYISAPLKMDDRVVGAIGFCSTNHLTFSEADRDFVRLVAVLVSSALERQVQRQRLDDLAYADLLTGLPNRARFLIDIEAAISSSSRYERPFALHFIDLDGFKTINDRAGHAVGDLALKEVARRLRASARLHDVPARLGGDEFVLLQNELEHAADARILGNRIVERLAEPYVLEGETHALGASIGIAIYPRDGASARALLQSADTALYRAKAAGKRRVEMTVSAERSTE